MLILFRPGMTRGKNEGNLVNDWPHGRHIVCIGYLPHANVMKQQSLLHLIQVLRALEVRYCQPPPPGCPRNIYKLMVECW